MNTIATREYFAHKADYDQLYYAYPVKNHPELTSLRRRTTHAGNQKGAKQVDRLGEISRAVKTVMDTPELHTAFYRDWQDYRRRRTVSHRNPDVYSIYGRTYSTQTLRDYVRAMFYIENRENSGPLLTPTPLSIP